MRKIQHKTFLKSYDLVVFSRVIDVDVIGALLNRRKLKEKKDGVITHLSVQRSNYMVNRSSVCNFYDILVINRHGQ